MNALFDVSRLEIRIVACFGIALLVLASSWFWLLIAAFRTSKKWGFAILFLPPASLVFLFLHFRQAVGPLLLSLVAPVLVVVPFLLGWYVETKLDLGERVRLVDGKQHITLTGWDKTDYSVLRDYHEATVLQMANADVTDQTLEQLKGMDKLEVLDLNNSQVSDEGLVILAELPSLRELRLARTRITDEGFRTRLLPLPTLMSVEVTGTPVKGSTLREWKKAKEGRRYLN